MLKNDLHGDQVRSMFDAITPVYDRMNRLMTFGQDRSWRRFLVRKIAPQPGEKILDLATGTGDLAFEVLRQQADVSVWAGDFAVQMMKQGQQRQHAERIHWLACDALSLPFADDCFDAVICGFLLRNVEDRNRAQREILRVLKPGARFASLDTMPPSGFAKPLVWVACRFAVPLLARLMTGRSGAYRYLGDSTLGFASPSVLLDELRSVGFEAGGMQKFWMNSVAVIWARKPS